MMLRYYRTAPSRSLLENFMAHPVRLNGRLMSRLQASVQVGIPLAAKLKKVDRPLPAGYRRFRSQPRFSLTD
jgi:hypothetical protein